MKTESRGGIYGVGKNKKVEGRKDFSENEKSTCHRKKKGQSKNKIGNGEC